MPQFLTTTPAGAAQALDVRGRSLLSAHGQLTSILASRLGRPHAELLAEPVVGANGELAWRTDLAGSASPASKLGPQDRARLERQAEQLIAEVRALTGTMRADGPSGHLVSHMLERALMLPPGDWLWSVGGRPVLVMWGHAAMGAVIPPVEPYAAPAAPVAARPVVASPAIPDAAQRAADQLAANAVAAPIEPAAAPDSSPRRRWPWALVAALALLALLLAGLLQLASTRQASEAETEARLRAARQRVLALEDELRRARAPTQSCMPDPPPAAAPPPEPVPPASAPDPLEPLRQRIAAAQTCDAMIQLLKQDNELRAPPAADLRKSLVGRLQSRCKDTLVSEAKNLCPGERPPQLAPEFVIVFDASPSMAYSLNKSAAEIEQAERARREDLVVGEPQRIRPAREAAVEVARRVPRDMSIGLVRVDSCSSGAVPVGFFGSAQRAALLGQLQSMRPHAFDDFGGTPLADGIERAARMVDGATREASILVVSDGEESCRGNPCAVGRAIASSKPKLRINVLDITGTGAGNCLAASTGGKVFSASNARQIAEAMRLATKDMLGPERCRAK